MTTPPPAEQPGQSGTEYPSTPTPGGTPIETPTYECTPTPDLTNYTYDEKIAYYAATQPAIFQEDGRTPVKQFDIMVVDNKPGYMACGIIAGAEGGASVEEMARAAVSLKEGAYTNETGIQPSPLAQALRDVYGEENVNVYDPWDLFGIYDNLRANNVVIVDMLVTTQDNAYTYWNGSGTKIAHFARVIGIDWEKQEVSVQNTLPGGDFWTIPFVDFQEAWFNPEVQAPLDNAEEEQVEYWGVAILR